jgi:hypothetical protein
MATLFSRTALDALAQTLDGVQYAGQVAAVVASTLAMATQAADDIHQTTFEDAWRTQARKDIANYAASLSSVSGQVTGGDPTSPVNPSQGAWAEQIKPAVMMLWNYVTIVQGQFPPNDSSGAGRFAGKLIDALRALWYGFENPAGITGADLEAIKSAGTNAGTALAGYLSDAGDTAETAIRRTVAGVGNAAAAALGPVKWYLAGAGIFFVVGLGTYFLVTSGGSSS